MSRTVLVTLSILWMVSLGVCYGQSNQPDTVRVTLGSTSGTPGGTVVVPVYFTPAEGSRVGRLELRVGFVSANLRFDKLETGIAAEIGSVALTHDLHVSRDNNDVESSMLNLKAEAPESSETGIPPGLLAYIQLKLNEGARPAQISLRTSGEAAEMGSGQALEMVFPAEATVEVIAPGSEPAVVCFFFSH